MAPNSEKRTYSEAFPAEKEISDDEIAEIVSKRRFIYSGDIKAQFKAGAALRKAKNLVDSENLKRWTLAYNEAQKTGQYPTLDGFNAPKNGTDVNPKTHVSPKNSLSPKKNGKKQNNAISEFCFSSLNTSKVELEAEKLDENFARQLPVYCICKRPWSEDEGRDMVGCDVCQDWFHLDCVGIKTLKEVENIDYKCPTCKMC
jgi:hypothetical protein